MLFRPVSVDELIDELATQAPHLTDEHLTRLGALVASLSGNKVSDSPEGGGRVISGSEVLPAPAVTLSGKATSDEVAEPEPAAIPESVPESDHCLRCGSADGWPLCPTCKDREPERDRCACGARLSKAARDAGHDKCAPCRVTHQSTPNSAPNSVPEKGPENVQSTGHKPGGKRCDGCGVVMARTADFNKCLRCRKAEDDLRSEDQGSRIEDREPSRGEPKPLAQHLGRKCADCEAPLSRYNPDAVCSSCQAKRRAQRVERVRQGDVIGFAPEPPSRESGAVAPRAKGDVVLSDGQLAAPLTVTEPRRDGQGRIICSTCNQPMIHFGCGCDPGELDDDEIPLDTRWQDGVFTPELASAAG